MRSLPRLFPVFSALFICLGLSPGALAQTTGLVSGNVAQDQARVTQDVIQLNADEAHENFNAVPQDLQFLNAQQQILAADQNQGQVTATIQSNNSQNRNRGNSGNGLERLHNQFVATQQAFNARHNVSHTMPSSNFIVSPGHRQLIAINNTGSQQSLGNSVAAIGGFRSSSDSRSFAQSSASSSAGSRSFAQASSFASASAAAGSRSFGRSSTFTRTSTFARSFASAGGRSHATASAVAISRGGVMHGMGGARHHH